MATIQQYINQFIRSIGSKDQEKARHKALLEKFISYEEQTLTEPQQEQAQSNLGITTGLMVDNLQFDTAAAPLPNAEGLLQWNATDGTLDLGMQGGLVTQQIGQELFIKVINKTGATITEGSAVYFNGRQGNRPKIELAKGDSETTSKVMGVVTHDIVDDAEGYITTFGYVRQIKTDYAGWAIGDTLFVSKTTAGELTNIEPDCPHHSDVVGSVAIVGGTGIGAIFVQIDRHKSLEELSDINGTPLTESGQFPTYNEITGCFDFDKNIYDIPNATLDPTGFIDNNSIAVTYSIVDRTITLTKTGGIELFWRGVKKTFASPLVLSARTAGNGAFFLSSNDGETFAWSTSSWVFSGIQVALALQGTTYHFGLKETHGLKAWQEHRDQHNIDGTLLASGGTITAGTYAENTATDAANSPGFNAAVLRDEDLDINIAAWIEGTYTTLYIGASGEPVFSTVDTLPFRSAGSYLLVNNPTTGTNTAGVTGKYYNVYQLMLPTTGDADSQKFRMVMVQPQQTFDSLAAAQAESITAINLGQLATLAPELKFYTRITYVTSASDNNTGKCRIATGGISYVVGSKNNPISVTGVLSSNHQALSNLDWPLTGHTGTANKTPIFLSTGAAGLSSVQLTEAGSVNLPAGQTYQINGTQITSLALSDVTALTNNYFPRKTAEGLVNSLNFYDGTNSTFVGGTGVTSKFVIKSTTGNGTATNSAFEVNVGNNGATNALTILNNAQSIFNGRTIIKGDATSDAPSLGSEILTSSNWTTTGWIGDFATGFTHTVGNTSVLSNSFTPTINTYYRVLITITNRTAGSILVSIGGFSRTMTTTRTHETIALSSGNLTITPTSDFDGAIVISLKTIGTSTPSLTLQTSSGTLISEFRNGAASNVVIGQNAGSRLSNSGIGNDGATNVMIGSGAGRNSTVSNSAVYIGYNAGNKQVVGGGTYVGIYSGENTLTGIENSFYGEQSGRNNVFGNSNCLFGIGSGFYLGTTTTAGNFIVGLSYTIISIGTTDFTLIGAASNTPMTSFTATGVGAGTGTAATTPILLSVFGKGAANFTSDGVTPFVMASNSSYFGSNTRASTNGVTNENVFGYGAIGSGSNTVTIGNSSITQTYLKGNIAIGTTDIDGTPAIGRLTIKGTTNNIVGRNASEVNTYILDVNGNATHSGYISATTAKLTTGATVGYFWGCTNIDGSGAWMAINQMVYPPAGIPISTGTAWGTSITDNSANWNTAYGWGNHATAGYISVSTPTNGDILYYNSGWQKLAKGLEGQVLTMIDGLPSWSFKKEPMILRFVIPSDNYTLTIPFYNTTGYNGVISWGDGSTSTIMTYDDTNRQHVYATAGTYDVELNGTFKGFDFESLYPYTELTEIIQWGEIGIVTWSYAFFGCTNLTKIPNSPLIGIDTLDENEGYGRLYFMFGETGLTSIPSNFFANCSNFSNPNDISFIFYQTAITSIPSGLFDNLTLIKNFWGVFQYCTGLTSIPTDLFRYNTLVDENAFNSTFDGCTGLTSIPTDLFRYNTLASKEAFYSTFRDCIGLSAIPEDLFYYNSVVSGQGYQATFRFCQNLALPTRIFNLSNISIVTSFATFMAVSNTSYSPTGTIQDVWNYTSATSTNAFDNCTALDNYASIPTAWK